MKPDIQPSIHHPKKDLYLKPDTTMFLFYCSEYNIYTVGFWSNIWSMMISGMFYMYMLAIRTSVIGNRN